MMNLAHARRLLDVDSACTPDEARQNYRDLVRVWHPDRFETDPRLRAKAEQRLAQITEAYRFLEQHGDRPAEPHVIRVQTPPVAVSSPRRSWMGHVAVALVVLAAMALVAMPRAKAPVVSTATFVESPADVPAVQPRPVVKTPAVIHAAPAARNFIARETDAILTASAALEPDVVERRGGQRAGVVAADGQPHVDVRSHRKRILADERP